MDTAPNQAAGAGYEAQLRAANEAVYKHSLELARLTQELQEANERQEGLIHFIGHEVKGSLTKAEGAFAALVEGDMGELPREVVLFAQEALRQTRDGVTSVTDILQAANQKRGTVSYEKAPLDLAMLIIEAVSNVRRAAEAKGLTLTLHLDESVKYPYVGDKKQLGEHVFRNLLENAVNYTPKGAVEVTLEKLPGHYRLSVTDSGVGISDEDKTRLFTEGGRGKESIKVNVHSTGYGLFIAKNVVEAHGGTIRAESAGPGKGSTFIVELPAES